MARFLQILTLLFLLLAVATVVVFFAVPESKTLFFVLGGTAVGIRLIYYFIRFITRE
ncbi:hypothetical protein [Porphyromonas sp.]|uniref:hypothetical protein n=1 Tax=Porphyromonas sp. TaxID=1924944 RepID=UPI0026DD8808|nr:hypothetical protein [Porphyromonas sp.]MDO4695889.1 hypothetical protein [Porphyromonas sp.]MDO4771898.1 hypothetical protein [Porphyromonas sp.]